MSRGQGSEKAETGGNVGMPGPEMGRNVVLGRTRQRERDVRQRQMGYMEPGRERQPGAGGWPASLCPHLRQESASWALTLQDFSSMRSCFGRQLRKMESRGECESPGRGGGLEGRRRATPTGGGTDQQPN